MRAYASGDAVAMNDKALMEVSYRLPYSHAYESSQRYKYEEFLREAARAGIDFSGPVTVTDVGCAYGGLLAVVHDMHPAAQLCGVECANSAIEYMARRRPHVRGAIADIEEPEPNFVAAVGGVHDVVLCTEVLEHLMRPEHALANLMALRPRGGIALTVPQGRVDTAAQHINFWSPESWRAFIEQHARGWRTTCGLCRSPGTPGGADNFAVLKPN
jgi:2-polyprenyl-3-methyl-5-hydroxy-6-metoxy-1,4-benzoquinol methylase